MKFTNVLKRIGSSKSKQPQHQDAGTTAPPLSITIRSQTTEEKSATTPLPAPTICPNAAHYQPRRRSGPKRVPSILYNDESEDFSSTDRHRPSINNRSFVSTPSSPQLDVSDTNHSMMSFMGHLGTADVQLTSGRCPFKHGTVYAGPYPGYVHGNPKRGICPNGCRPELNSDVTEFESPQDTLLREATEFIELYYHERQDEVKGNPECIPKADRLVQVKKCIQKSGTYEHTFDELQHGARMAWRNAPKCANRKYWQQLKLLDCRDVATNKGMFDSCIQHLAKAMSCGSSEAYITVFKPAPPDKLVDGPRIWNDQLLQYAAYNNEDGEVSGDPKNLRFTEMLKERFGWDGPPDGVKGAYDYLPLVIQADPKGPPELFEVPLEMCPPVHIHHPRYPELSQLHMQWYPIPAVCALDLDVGGIVYTAVPFNGWYANTEVLRDLTDEDRYNMLVPVAEALGMDADTKPGEAPFWKDEVMHILSMAVYHSYKSAKVAMIDHHSLIDMFWKWYNREMLARKYCPVNWKWVIPPMSSTTNQAYMGLNKAQEYTLKPAYLFGKSFILLETNYFGRRDTSKALDKLVQSVYLALLFKRAIRRMRGRKQPVLIIYASVTGNSAKYASELGALLRPCANISFFDACGANAATTNVTVLPLIEAATLTVFVSSTQGNGELPSLAEKFFSFLFGTYGSVLSGKQCAVLGFGSSQYPIFCGAAIRISKELARLGAEEVVPRGMMDAVQGEENAFYQWSTRLVTRMTYNMPFALPLVLKLLKSMEENTASSLVRTRNIVNCIKVEVYSAEEVQNAAAQSYMTSRRGSVSSLTMDNNSMHGRRLLSSVSEDEPSVSGRTSMDNSVHSSYTRRATMDTEDGTQSLVNTRIMQIIGNSGAGLHSHEKKYLVGQVKSRDDLISSEASAEGESEVVTRKTSLVKIDLGQCGNPPYQPGDHIRVFPRTVISPEELQGFVSHLMGNDVVNDLHLDDHIYVTLENEDIPRSELAVDLPLLHKSIGDLLPLEYFFKNHIAVEASVSMQDCIDLAQLATGTKDRAVLNGIGFNKKEYEDMTGLCGMKWIDLFGIFPSLSKQAVVGSELHVVVGRYIYSRGGSKMEAGVCSNFLTSTEPGDEVRFDLESAPSFHHPLDPTCPIIFVCTGTGIAPIRGLLQKRSYFRSRGEKLGKSFLIFGSRSSSEGLFHHEIKEFQKHGALTKIFMCYSREVGKEKEYTTDKIRSERVSNMLSPILKESNAHVFICGSANMAEAAKTAFCDISPPGCFDTLTEEGRLHCDVFGALSSGRKKAVRVASYSLLGDSEEDEFEDELVTSDMNLAITECPNLRDMFATRSSSCSTLGNNKLGNVTPINSTLRDLLGTSRDNNTYSNRIVNDKRKHGKHSSQSMIMDTRDSSLLRESLFGKKK